MHIFTLFLTFFPLLLFAGISEERTWTGNNGKQFVGSFHTRDSDGKYIFTLANRNIFRIDPANISEEDLKWIEEQSNPPKDTEDKPSSALTDFIPDPPIDRSKIPVINQSDYGNKASDCVPSSFCNFLLWWDQEGYLPIDKRGDFDKKAQWIHTRTSRSFGTRNNSGTSFEDAKIGFQEYFAEDLGELATYRLEVITDCSPKNLARYTRGPLATFLEVTTLYGDKEQGSHWVALVSAKENGEILFHTWGAAIEGKINLAEKDGKLPEPAPQSAATEGKHYKIEIMNREKLPDWFSSSEVSFNINPSYSDCLVVLAPYKYQKPGEKKSPPADPRFDS